MKKTLLTIIVLVSLFNQTRAQSLGTITFSHCPCYNFGGLLDTISVYPVPGALVYHWFAGPPSPQSGNVLVGTGFCCLLPYSTSVPYLPIMFTGSQQNFQICVYATDSCCSTDTACCLLPGAPPAPIMNPANSSIALPNTSGIYSILPPNDTCINPAADWVLIPASAGSITGNLNDTVTVNFSASFTSCQLCARFQTPFNLYGPYGCMTITTPVGIDEFAASSGEFTVYPNPAGEELNVQSSSRFNRDKVQGWNEEINIYDMEGRKVMQSIFNNQYSIINIKSLQSGMYFIEINGVRRKFVKQ